MKTQSLTESLLAAGNEGNQKHRANSSQGKDLDINDDDNDLENDCCDDDEDEEDYSDYEGQGAGALGNGQIYDLNGEIRGSRTNSKGHWSKEEVSIYILIIIINLNGFRINN